MPDAVIQAAATVEPAPPPIELVRATTARLGLREYQERAVLAALGHLHDGRQVHLLTMPTGTGKTWVGAGIVACLLAAEYAAVWVCKRWDLLKQAVDGLTRILPEYRSAFRRIGGGDSVLRQLPEGEGGRVYVTTLQTWCARGGVLPAPALPSARQVIVWDEAHWAARSPTGAAFRGAYLGAAAVYGLTATPVVGDQAHVAFRLGAEDLWGTVLATPVVREVATGVEWSPEVRDDDFTPGSLHRLGTHAGRNGLIVGELIAGRAEGRYRRTVVFACDIPHATELHRRLAERGVDARVVHSQLPRKAQAEAIEQFRDGRVGALVNVGMLAEGFDLPEIDSVFLARPTRSRVLLIQMIGRGARKAPGKECFRVVDFADSLLRFGDEAVRAGVTLPAREVPARPRRYTPPTKHQAPGDVPRFELYEIPGHGPVPIALGQTFGVEIELTAPGGVPPRGPGWDATAGDIIRRLAEVAGGPVHPVPVVFSHSFPGKWHVKYDGSAGWEVVSPVLRDAEGFDELRVVCEGLAALVDGAPGRLKVNHRTGLHVTLATRLDSLQRLRGFARRVQRVEPGLFTLAGPSRLFQYRGGDRGYEQVEGNHFCFPLRALGDVDRLALAELADGRLGRYRTVNLTRWGEAVQLLEVRLHGGTYEFHKVALWLSVWMQLFHRSRYDWGGRGASGPVFPGGDRRIDAGLADAEDVVKLLAAEGIPLTPNFTRLLRERRRELRESWRRVLPNRVAGWEAAGWYGGA